jgi:hypothetical protein
VEGLFPYTPPMVLDNNSMKKEEITNKCRKILIDSTR